ncbi:MAG: Rpn family recombination-promoting nuclease/putative transposase [Oscillospiraceae bacterium]|jgi:predicted transposase/invertase (TIGR01784 family)|nr:Rpn family recombination-promoting nuclease/putative transposase [Oscillospiraceae bacterium]
MSKLQYTFKTDTLFKMLFVRNQDLLWKLVAVLLRIPLESIQELVVRNPEIAPEMLGEKFCRLDINMIVNGQCIDLEVQVANEGDYPERVMYYWAREFSSSLATGESYSTLPRTIVISIIDFSLFNCTEYYSFFQALEVTRHTLLSDKMGFQFFELTKLPGNIDEKDSLLLWLSLFKANTEEELEKIRAMEVPEMEEAINAYYTITASSEFREIERLRAKARHDEAQALHHARQEGRQEGISERNIEIVRNALQMGMPIEDIAKLTGLTCEEVENLRKKF